MWLSLLLSTYLELEFLLCDYRYSLTFVMLDTWPMAYSTADQASDFFLTYRGLRFPLHSALRVLALAAVLVATKFDIRKISKVVNTFSLCRTRIRVKSVNPTL